MIKWARVGTWLTMGMVCVERNQAVVGLKPAEVSSDHSLSLRPPCLDMGFGQVGIAVPNLN